MPLPYVTANPPAIPVNMGAPYPTLSATPGPVGGGVGLPAMKTVVPWHQRESDVGVRGALKVNPAYAADFYAGRYLVEHPHTGDTEPAEVKNKLVTQTLATGNSPNAWKSMPWGAMVNAFLFGGKPAQSALNGGKAQAGSNGGKIGASPAANRKFIAPLALYNDASQWVNRLMFNRPMTRWDAAVSADIALRAQYSMGPPPIDTANLAGGTLNLQLQLGTIVIQGMQLTTSASNYYGG